MTEVDPSLADERRDFFRIEDHVVLNYRRVPQGQLPQPLQHLEDNGFSLAATFAGISQRTRSLQQQVRQDSPATADYLKALEQKVDMLAQVLMLREMELDEQETREVNLSAGGMEFRTKEALEPGNWLEIKFVVFPDRLGILAGCRVVRCERDTGCWQHPYRVAVEFTHIRESDRQLIVRHVLSRQSQRIRLGQREGD